MATTTLDRSHQIDLRGNAILATDLVLSGTNYSSGSKTQTSLGATKTLIQSDTGSTVVFDRLAGTTVTLPVPVVGTSFSFYVNTAATSNAHKVITDAATTFIVGGIFVDKSLTVTRYAADGTTIVSLNWNGTTTGGLPGTYAVLRCISATEWQIEGVQIASGTLATPFANS